MRNKRRLLAALLASATVVTSVFPGAVYAADKTDQPSAQIEQEAEKASTEAPAKEEKEEKAEPVEEKKAEAEPEVKAPAEEKKEEAPKEAPDTAKTEQKKESSDTAKTEQKKESSDTAKTEQKKDTAGTGKTETAQAAETTKPEDKGETSKPAQPEQTADTADTTPAETIPEEQEEVVEEAEVVTGRMVFYFDEVNGAAKVIISSDKGADEDDPSITYKKEADGHEKIDYRNSSVKDAVVSEKDGVITMDLEVGTKIEVIAEPADGYKVAEYSVTIDDGGRDVLPFAGKSSEDHIEWKHEVAEETAVFELSTKEAPAEEEPAEEAGAAETAETAETAEAAATEEPAEEAPEKAKAGSVTFNFGNADASAELFVSGKNDAVLTYNKEAGEKGTTLVADDVKSVSQDNDATTVEFEAGTEIKVVAEAKEGFKISECNATVDGEKKSILSDGVIEWTYTVNEEPAAFEMKTEAAQEEPAAPAATLSIKLDSEGGLLKVMDGDKAVASFEKTGDVVNMTDAEGKTAPAELTDGMAVAVAGDPGKEYTITAEAKDGYNVTIFTVTDNTGKAKELGFFDKLFKKDSFSTNAALAEGNTTVEVSFTNMPAFAFEQKVGDITVKLNADKGVFPEGTVAEVREMTEEEAKTYVESAKAMAEDPEGVTPVLTVDVTFKDKDGNEIHPAGMVNVTFANVAEEEALMSVYHATDADAAKTEKLESTTSGKDVVTSSANFSPLTLLKASSPLPNPAADNGTFTGSEATPSSVKVDGKDPIHYEDVGYKMNGDSRDKTEPITLTLPNGTKTTAICFDPDSWGMTQGKTYTHIEKSTSANVLKALYYGIPGYGHNYAAEIAGSTDGGIVVAHYALAFYGKSNQLSHGHSMFENQSSSGDAQDIWNDMPSNLQADIKSYINKIASLPTPSGVTAFIVYPNEGYDTHHQDGEHFVQYYAFLLKDTAGKLTLVKSSANTAITNGNSNYSLAGAVYTVKNSAGTSVGTLTTKADGTSNTLTLSPGTYTVKETSASNGFKLDATNHTVTITANTTQTVRSSETPKTGNVTLVKSSANTAITNGNSNYSLAGAVYTVRNSAGTSVGTLTTKADGTSNILTGLPLGTYTVKETSASKGFKLDTADHAVTITADTTQTVRSQEIPHTGKVKATKTSANTDITNGLKTYTLANAEFGVYDTEAHAKAGGSTGLIQTLKTDANGNTPESKELPLGTYYIAETKAPTGYKLPADDKDRIKPATVVEGQTTAVTVTVSDPCLNDPRAVIIDKKNKYTSVNPRPLTGTEFEVKYYDGYYTASNLPSNAVRTWVWTVGYKDGIYFAGIKGSVSGDPLFKLNGEPVMPLGTYTITEKKAAEGYVNDGKFGGYDMYIGQVVAKSDGSGAEVKDVQGKPKTENSLQREFEVKETPQFGGFKTVKVDAETQKPVTERVENSSATFKLVSENDYNVTTMADTTKSYAKGETVATYTSDPKTGVINVPATMIQTGKYYLQETEPAEGYLLNSKQYHFEVVADKQVEVGDEIPTTSGVSHGIPNEPIRGDVNFRKIDFNTQRSMADIQFKITNKRTGESHTISTDKNGIFDSTAFPHTKNTNGGGMTDGVWFGEEDDIDNSKGAFYYGDYTLEELPGENNKGYEMASLEFSIYQHGRVVDLARVDNMPKPAFETELVDKDGEHEMLAAKGTQLTDTVYYSNCNKYIRQTFTVNGSLVDKATGEVLAEATATPKIRSSEGSFDVKFNIDASTLEGKEVVAYQVVSDEEGTVLATLKDPMNADETVRFPKIATVATDNKTKDHIAKAEESITINDTVNYEKLTPGKKYVMTGKLIDKATGEDLKDADGKAVTGEKEFTASESGKGSVVITFTFKANKDDYEGKSVVAFEQCKGADNDKLYAIHEDPDDEDQTVHLPKVRTLADDDNTGIPVTLADKNASVTDHVSYENLIPGKEYTLKGVLILKSTGAEAAKAEKTFTPSTENGTEDLTFTFDASPYKNEDLVAMEELFLDDHSIAEHKDPEDPAQTIHVPDGYTTAADTKTKMQNALAEKETIIADEVFYKNLLPGKTYRIKGKVMAKETGEEIPSVMVDVNGKEIEYHEFTAKEKDGSEVVYFKYDSSALAGKDAVVFEDVTYNDKPVIVHHELEDEPETIHHPDGRTIAIDKKTGIKNTLAEKDAIVEDTFEYENLIPGNEYHITGKVMDKETGEEIESIMVDADGKPVENGYFVLNPEEENGNVKLYFMIDASVLENHDAVCFERVSVNGAPVIIHENIEDEEQTTHIPEGRTTARDSETQVQLSLADDSVTIIDTFIYKNLIPGTEYTVTGRVMIKSTGDEVESKITGAEGEAEALTFDEKKVTFTPSTKDGEIDISFTFNGSALAGEDAVVFERAYHNDVPVIIHENIDDEKQTDHIPDGRTTAVSKENGSHSVKAEEKTTIMDTFFYENLLPGKEYSITGRLMNKETNEEVKSQMVDADGKPIEKFTFTADKKDGSVVLYFEVNTADLKGKDLVTFEKVQFEDKDIIIHENIEDEEQTVHVPDGYTTALDSDTQDHIANADEQVTIKDEFFYQNLVPGQKYTVKGVLMDKATNKPLIADGKEVTGETTFVPESKDGSVIITFTFNGKAVAGTTTVAFETVYVNGKELLVHAKIDDDDQTVEIPDGYTTALDAKTGTHTSHAEKKVTIKDEVFYKNLLPGKEYTVKGVLMDKSTRKPLLANGSEVTAEAKFTAKEKDGSVVITFTFDGSALAGTTTVAFETIYYKGKEVLVHANIEDADQTIHFPEVKTTATDKKDGDHKLASSGKVTVVDRVVYKNLVPGKTYKVYGRLMSKATGNEAKVNGSVLSAESNEFVAEKPDGTIDIEVTFNASDLKAGDYVMFEKLFEVITDENGGGKKEVLVGEHEDLKDKSQTVTIPSSPKKPGGGHGGRVQTGEIPVLPIAGAAAVAALAAGVYLLKTRKKEDQE